MCSNFMNGVLYSIHKDCIFVNINILRLFYVNCLNTSFKKHRDIMFNVIFSCNNEPVVHRLFRISL